MTEDATRTARLVDELARLTALKADSTLFDFEAAGDPPTRFVVSFRGKGVSRPTAGSAKVEDAKLHQCEIRIPYAYPDRPPDLRWLTPIAHPNISFSGLVKLTDIGLPWEQDLTLDLICERLWDMARLAYYDENSSTNYGAKQWLAEQTSIALPVDNRPLRDKSLMLSSNVVKYERRTTKGQRHLPRSSKSTSDVLFIDDQPKTATPKRARGDDDVVYIGYE